MPDNPNHSLLAQAIQHTVVPQGWLPDDEPIFDFDKQVRLRKSKLGYCVWRLRRKASDDDPETGDWLQISNFVIDCTSLERFVDHQDQYVQRRVSITDETGAVFETEITAEQMNTLSNFTKWIESKGNYTFSGDQSHLTAIKRSAFPPAMPETSVKYIAGHDPKSKTWLFANSAVRNGKIYEADPETELIHVPDLGTFRLAESDDPNVAVSKLPRPSLTNSSRHTPREMLRHLLDDMITLWGPQVENAMGWMLAHLFRNRCMSDPGLKNFPLLFVVSPRAQGKNTLVRMLMRLYGIDDYSPHPLAQLTETSIYTLSNVMCDIPLWCDEYQEDLVKAKMFLREALKNNYDGAKRTVGTPSQWVTKSRIQRTGICVTGEMRPSNPALDSRYVAVEVHQNADHALLAKLERRSRDLSCVMLDILANYEEYWTLYRDRIEVVLAELTHANPVQMRLAECYARTCAMLDCYMPDGTRLDRFKHWLTGKVERHEETNLMAEMVSRLPYLIQVKNCPIPYRICSESHRMHVYASFFMNKFFEDQRDVSRLKVDELIRLGKDGKLLHPALHQEDRLIAAQVNAFDRDSGRMRTTIQKCFVFDLRNSIVADAAQKLLSPEEN